MTKLSLYSLSFSLFALTACADYEPGSLIVDTRVLGARVEVEGDTMRSTPRAGETANLSFLIAGIEAEPQLSWSLVVCLRGGEGDAPCASAPLTVAEGTGTPSLKVVVPDSSQLGDRRSLHIAGIVCTRGTPNALDASCSGDGAKGFALLYDLSLSRAEDGSDENLQPNLESTRLLLDEGDWTATPGPATDACESNLPEVNADAKEHDITFEFGPDARELYVDGEQREVLEELQLSHFVTGGELARQFSFISPSDTRERPTVKVKWTAPKQKDLTTARLRVSLLLVLRDQRGGIARTERAVCVVR